MSDLKDGAGSSYPGALDTYTNVVDNVDTTSAVTMNNLADAIINIETELGTDPAGNLSTVKAFLQTEHTVDGAHSDSFVCVLSGVQTITGQKTFNANIAMGSNYTVDGVDLDQDILLTKNNQIVNDAKIIEDAAIKLGDSASTATETGFFHINHSVSLADPGGSDMERTVISYTLPANSLVANNDFVEIFVVETASLINNPPQKPSRLYFGNTVIHASNTATTASPQSILAKVFVSGNRQKALTINKKRFIDAPNTYYNDVRIDNNINEDLTSPVTIKVTVSGTVGDYALRTFDIRYGRGI